VLLGDMWRIFGNVAGRKQMIRRWYHISVRQSHNDTTGGYRYSSRLFYRTSWIPQHDAAYAMAIDEIKNNWGDDDNGEVLEIINFSRIS